MRRIVFKALESLSNKVAGLKVDNFINPNLSGFLGVRF